MDSPEFKKEEAKSVDPPNDIDFLRDVSLKVNVELGRAILTVRDLLSWKRGTVLELDKDSGEPLDIRANGNLIGRGEPVIVNEKFGVRVTLIAAPDGWDEIVD